MPTKLNKAILATLASATAAKKRLVEVSEEPRNQHSNFMVSAIVLSSDLTEDQFGVCRSYLKANGIPTGTVNTVARFSNPNPGHEKLVELLADCESKNLPERLEHLASVHISSYGELAKACLIVSEDAVDKRLAKQLSSLTTERQGRIVAKANLMRLEAQAKAQDDETSLKQASVVASSVVSIQKPKQKTITKK